jgi:Protein of unknown function (DUF3352)
VLRPAVTALAAVLALLPVGCGDESESDASGAAAAIPPGAIVYAEGDISGVGDQHANLNALLTELGEIPLLGSPLEPRDLIAQALEDLGADNGVDISYAEDFEPWLGDSIALGYLSLTEADPAFVLSIAADDEQLARDALDRIVAEDAAGEDSAEYDGVSYYAQGDYAVGVFDEMLVLSTPDEFEAAVDASRGESLADDDAVSEAFGVLPEERLGSLYVDVAAIAEAEVDTESDRVVLEEIRGAVPELLEPVAAGLVAGERSLAVDVAVPHGEDAPDFTGTEKLAEAPADAFAALAFAGLGEQLAKVLDEVESLSEDAATLPELFEEAVGVSLDEVLADVGDTVAYGRGELPDEFVVALEAALSGESDAPQQLVEGAERLAGEDENTVLGPALGAGTGFSAEPTPDVADRSPVRFVGLEVDEEELRAVVAGDREAAEQPVPPETLGETDPFQAADEALSDDFEMVGFANLDPILDSFVPGGSILDLAIGEVPPEQAMLGFLADKLGFAAAGVREDGDFSVQRLVVGLR